MRQSRFTNARKRSIAPRRGTILILFALFLFGFMGLAALVIDLGFVRLTQLQMQSAADSAAMEGMWLQGESNQRERVRDHVQYVFDDDFELANDEQDFGAGPRLTFSEGIPLTSEFNASELIEYPPADPVYKPRLELNEDDDPHGDMVAGRFVEQSDVHLEDDHFFRNDFIPGDHDESAFLVRLRRSNLQNALDNEQEGVTSRGPAVPLLFSRGALLHPDFENNSEFDLRGRGVTVRATGIASGVPAKSVGVRDANLEHGLLPIALSFSHWQDLLPETSRTFEVSGNLILASGSQVGRVIRDDAPVVVGDDVTALEPESAVSIPVVPAGYIAIYDSIPSSSGTMSMSTNDIVIGFAQVEISNSTETSFQMTIAGRVIARENASAIFVKRPSATDIDWQALMNRHRQFADPVQDNSPLLAPASVR